MATCKECLHFEKCATPRGNTRYYNKALDVNGDVSKLCEWFIKQKRGQWLPVYKTDWIYGKEWLTDYCCTECGQLHNKKKNYCPNCGAKMDLKE